MMKLNLKFKRSTMIKLAIGIVAICLISLLIKWRSSCNCEKKNQKKVTFGTLRPVQSLSVTAVPDPDVRFGDYDPDLEEEEDVIVQEVEEVPVIETYAEYVPEYQEKYIDAKDTFSHPNFPERLI